MQTVTHMHTHAHAHTHTHTQTVTQQNVCVWGGGGGTGEELLWPHKQQTLLAPEVLWNVEFLILASKKVLEDLRQ